MANHSGWYFKVSCQPPRYFWFLWAWDFIHTLEVKNLLMESDIRGTWGIFNWQKYFNQLKHLTNKLFTTSSIHIFKVFCHFLGYFRIKIKQQLFPVTHIRAVNTWSSQILFSQLFLRNAWRNEKTQCNLFHEYLVGTKLSSFTNFFFFFLKYIFW